MFAPSQRPRSTTPSSQISIWLLVLALAFQSLSAAVVGLTGIQHRHIACAQAETEPEFNEGLVKGLLRQLVGDGAMAILEARQHLVHAASVDTHAVSFPVVWTGGLPDDLGDGDDALPEAEVQGSAACPGHSEHEHAHGGFERHTHARADASVFGIGQADRGDDASLMHAELPPCLEATALSIEIAFVASDCQPWPVHQQAQPRGWCPAPQERPPRA